jgi:hypothetical protein
MSETKNFSGQDGTAVGCKRGRDAQDDGRAALAAMQACAADWSLAHTARGYVVTTERGTTVYSDVFAAIQAVG